MCQKKKQWFSYILLLQQVWQLCKQPNFKLATYICKPANNTDSNKSNKLDLLSKIWISLSHKLCFSALFICVMMSVPRKPS